MPSYNVTYMEKKTLTVWFPETATTDVEKAQLALHHIAMNTLVGNESKLLSVEPTFPRVALEQITEPTNVAPLK